MNLPIYALLDGYKMSHPEMYDENTTEVCNNITPRSVSYYKKEATSFFDDKIVVAGVRSAVNEIRSLFVDFFMMDREKLVSDLMELYCSFTEDFDHPMIRRWLELYDYSHIPLEFRSIEDGYKVNAGVPIATIRNTEPRFFWLSNTIESLISSMIWKTCTVATIAHEYRNIAKHYADITGTDDFTVSIQMHDFSFRGMSGYEDSARSGIGHLMSFVGSDNIPAVKFARLKYEIDETLAMGVPATEHAVATTNILNIAMNDGDKLKAEQEFIRKLITEKFPTGIVSYVSDSFDYWSVVTEILPALKDVIMSRNGEGIAPDRLVIRPDSGNPVEVICGVVRVFDTEESAQWLMEEEFLEEAREACGDGCYGLFEYSGVAFVKETGRYYKVETKVEYNRHDKKYYFVDDYETTMYPHEATAQEKGTIQCLWETFGGTINDKGYKVLDSHIGLIYGDSITRQRAVEIFDRLMEKGFASGNVVLGIGSYTYQHMTRDTLGFAVKVTSTVIDGKRIAVYKEPKTDSGKNSARGLLMVNRNDNGDFELKQDVSVDEFKSEDNYLRITPSSKDNLRVVRERLINQK